MAINPASMDQCKSKCRCITGPNQGLAYQCDEPCLDGETFSVEHCECYPMETNSAGEIEICPNGIGGTLISTLSSRVGGITVTTFFPSLQGGAAGGGGRVVDNVMQVFNGSSFVDVGRAPFEVGEEYLGQIITEVDHELVLQSNC